MPFLLRSIGDFIPVKMNSLRSKFDRTVNLFHALSLMYAMDCTKWAEHAPIPTLRQRNMIIGYWARIDTRALILFHMICPPIYSNTVESEWRQLHE